jgi:hypothetical protein
MSWLIETWVFYPLQRIKITEILEDEWFKKGYKPPHFEEGEDVYLDNFLWHTCILSWKII